MPLSMPVLSPGRARPPPARLFHTRTQYAAPPAESGKMTALTQAAPTGAAWHAYSTTHSPAGMRFPAAGPTTKNT